MVNPIPTGHGRNQPIFECHVTTTGRNRVKRLQVKKFVKKVVKKIVKRMPTNLGS